MGLKPWREVALPHRDIREGKFDESTFAADLADVLADRGPLEYRDPQTFFRKTYPTEGMVKLLAAILARLAGKGAGEPIIQLQTPFGGGKTHSLVALYHLFTSGEEYKNLDLVQRVLNEAGVTEIPDVALAAFVGTAADPLKGKTPWGAIAEQLAKYELLRDHDERRRTPGKELLHRLLGDRSVLILMDEVAEYVAKCIDPEKLRESGYNIEAARAYQTQVLAFMQELTETVKILPRAALVVTLPSSAPYGEEGERALYQLQQIFGRMEAIYEPVRGEEIYEVIRRRLFEDPGDPQETRRIAEAYFELYQRLGEEVPAKVREPAYRDRIRRAYPFHPELIDILFERWSTLPTFQRTRHVLWLLAEIVSDLYRREHPAPLIQPAHLNLANPAIRSKLVKHIGQEYNSVIASDIADTNAKAQAIDRRMGSEYAPFGVASGLATAIFLYSFSGGERKGAGISQLRLALLREGLPPPIVGDALRKLEDELDYLHPERGLYRFTNQPNLNRIKNEREDIVGEENIEEELRDWLEKLAGRELKVFLFPQASEDIPDTRELKLILVAPEEKPAIEELLEKSGEPFRVYRNTVFVLTAGPQELLDLRRQIKRYLALRSIRDDKPLMKQLSEEDKKTLEEELKDAEGRIPFQLLSAYRHLAKAGAGEQGPGIEWFDLGLPTVGEKSTIAKRVRDYLKSQELLLDRIAPHRVLQKTLKTEETEKPLKEIYEMFLKYPHLPLLEGEQVLRQAVSQGVSDGLFGLRIGERVYFNETVPSFTLEDAVLIRKEAIREEKPEEGAEIEAREPEREAVAGRVTGKEAETPIPPGKAIGARSLTLRVRFPWDKMADFLRGVLIPLRQDGADLQIEVLLQAHSEGGFQKKTLEEKVKETLRQIDAEVEEERIEE
jgi:hypothetical protein